jgi:hypothetical protein
MKIVKKRNRITLDLSERDSKTLLRGMGLGDFSKREDFIRTSIKLHTKLLDMKLAGEPVQTKDGTPVLLIGLED